VFDLASRVAIVTGGNGGIGLGMARGLARAGARVVVAARNADKSKAAVRELEEFLEQHPDSPEAGNVRDTIEQIHQFRSQSAGERLPL